MSACLLSADRPFSYPRSRAVGREAKEIQHEEIGAEREILEAPGTGAAQRAGILAILQAMQEHGEHAQVTFESAQRAIDMLRGLLLISGELPGVSIDPDGEVSLEWYREPRRVFSVSVGANGELNYAGLFGGSRVHGVEIHTIEGEEIPSAIRAGIQRVYA